MQLPKVAVTTHQDRFHLRLFPLFMVLMVLAVAGCNTIGGAGKDLSAAGRAIDDTAESAKR